MTLRLGCIADDFTGATDVAASLRRAGLPVTVLFGQPGQQTPPPATGAVVVALKTRTVPVEDAVAKTMSALAWLQRNQLERVYFKYCSTFDSTPDGNIGHVIDALLDQLGESLTLVCPASPEHGRTSYQGHLFVDDRLLSETSMRDHPLTPMTDPDIRRVLSRQTPHRVGLLPLSVVRHDVAGVGRELDRLRDEGVRHVVVDAASDEDLLTVAESAPETRLLTGGAGLAAAVGQLLSGGSAQRDTAVRLPAGPSLVLAGSCSDATQEQVARAAETMPAYHLDPASTPDPAQLLANARAWLLERIDELPVLIYSTASAADRARAVAAMGPDTAQRLESVLAALARDAVGHGTTRIVVAGGETSGAVVQSLGLPSIEVAGEADPGVPWCVSEDGRVAVLLKSGNFGQADLLVRASQKSVSP